MEKHTSSTSYSNYVDLIKTRSWVHESDPVLSEFQRLVRVRDARPTLLVEYRREGLVARDDPGVRITLDHSVGSTRAASLLPEATVMRAHRPRSVILEIKTPCRGLPGWLEPLVRDHALTLVSNSKYAQGVETVHAAFTGLERRGL